MHMAEKGGEAFEDVACREGKRNTECGEKITTALAGKHDKILMGLNPQEFELAAFCAQ